MVLPILAEKLQGGPANPCVLRDLLALFRQKKQEAGKSKDVLRLEKEIGQLEERISKGKRGLAFLEPEEIPVAHRQSGSLSNSGIHGSSAWKRRPAGRSWPAWKTWSNRFTRSSGPSWTGERRRTHSSCNVCWRRSLTGSK